MAAVELKLSLAPELDVPKLNAMINALKQSLGPLGKEIKPIDAAALNSELKKIESEAAKAAAEFDKVAQSTEKVKNSAAGFDKVFKFNQITQGVTTIANSFQAVLSVGNEFEATLAAVGAVTGQSGEGLTKLGDGARELAKQFGTSASENLKSFQGILSKFGPQVADNAAALKSMGDTVNTLSAASGDAADVSMAALTDTMLQLGLVSGDAAKDADTMRQVADALAASAKVGAAEIPQVAQSILQAGVAAKGANLSLEQTTAAIQVLAVGGKTGSEAGVALRNVLGLLQKQSGPGAAALKNMGTSVEELASVLTTQGLEAALTKLKAGLDTTGSTAERNAALMTLFGTENSAAAGILLDNLGQFGAFTEGISDAVQAGTAGADGASAQAAARLGTAEAIAGRLKAQIEDVFIGIQGTLGSGVAGILAATAQVAPTLSSITQIKSLLPDDAVGQVKEYATQLLAKFIPSVFATNAAVATSGATATTSATAFSSLWAAVTGPVALVVGAIALVVGGLYLMYQNVESFRDKVDGIFDFFAELWTVVQPVLADIGGAIADVGALVFDVMITPFEFLVTIIGEAVGAIFGLIGAGAQGAGTMETLKSVIAGISGVVDSVKAAIAGITGAFAAVKDGIKDSIGKLAEGDLIGAAQSFLGIGEAAGEAFVDTTTEAKKLLEQQKAQTAEAKKLLEQQKAQTAEAKNTAASVSEITKSYNEAFNDTKQARDEGISQQIALQAAISKLAKDDPERKRLVGELAAIKAKNRENDKLYDIEVRRQKEVNAQYEEKEKKEKSIFQTIKSTYETEAERLENAQKRFEIDVETQIIAEERKKNSLDELSIAEKEVETIKGKLEAARQLGSIDDTGNVTVNAKLTGADADDAKKLLDDLYIELLQARNKVGDVKLKASIEEIELRAQLRQEELDALREQVEAGILPSAALIDELGKEINKINEEILVADAKTKVKLKKQADSYDGEIRKLQKKEYDEAVRLIDEKAKAESDARKEQLSAVKAQTEAIIAASRTASELTASDTRDSALADLERQREEELISEAEFKAKKEELESNYQNRMTTIRSQDAGQRLALQLDTDTKELEARRATLEEKLRLAKASGETESAKKLQDELTELDKTVKEKGTQLTAAVDVLKAGINESITGLFQGDEDAMKNSMRSTLATLAGFLERIAAAAVLEIVLTSAPIKALASAAGPLAPLVLGGISALINSGVNALLQPILSKVLSFSTGGVFTSPTLAMVGDASRLGGPNIEYLLRNDQMNALMREVLDRHDNKVVGAIAVLSEEIRSMSTRLVIRGSDLHAAVTRRDDAISARARPLPA